MPEQVQQGTVIFRRYDPASGFDESSAAFTTLDSLFALCLQANELVDRVIIEGQDANGNQRTVTLVFQSVTVSGSKSEND